MSKDSKEIFVLKCIRKENGIIIDSLILGIYTDLDKIKNTTEGYILKNGEELWIEKQELNKELINRNINFENEECMKINKNYWNKYEIT